MYTEYFGLRDRPFSIAPDPEYLYMSAHHREALAHLIYGFQTDGGFVLLTGEVGTGKTTVCRCLLEQVPDDAEIAFVLNPKVSAAELLETICDELGIDYPERTTSIKVFVDAINRFLLETHAEGRKTVLIIDEAQNLSVDVLEQIRLLTNLETNKKKLLQVIMIGQPELRDLLKRQELRQLEQRVTARTIWIRSTPPKQWHTSITAFR
jgi:general secretion pathway protein A